MAELNNCPRTIEKILSTLVVSLEQETGFKPNEVRHTNQTNVLKNSSECLKSVYMGIQKNSRYKANGNYFRKLDRIKLSLCLFEVYQAGCLRIQSEAKRRYYQECQD